MWNMKKRCGRIEGGGIRSMGKDSGAAQIAQGRLEAERSLLENKSHEIRTYMTRIISMTDLTLMTEVTEEQRGYLSIVKSSTGLLLKVLNDILDNSKIQSGSVDPLGIPEEGGSDFGR